jgi:polyhydroxybutyrate depolymerase
VLCVLTNVAVVEAALAPGLHTRNLDVDGRSRSAIVYVPRQATATKPLPVVLCFHGGASYAERQMSYSGLNEKADAARFIVVYPSGTGAIARLLTWNSGNCCGSARRQKVNDVAFVEALLDDLAKTTKIDEKRIFATGISNGGMMCYELAARLSHRIAAIAPVAGPMGTENCSPKHPVSIIHFHGTKDEFAAFNGGPGKKSRTGTDFFSVKHTMDRWVKANGCGTTPAVSKMPNKADDGMTVTRKRWTGGKDGAEVVLYQIDGGGHTWPGRTVRLKFLGPVTMDISANDLMWDFFQKHPRK